jgi:hypothetical protein
LQLEVVVMIASRLLAKSNEHILGRLVFDVNIDQIVGPLRLEYGTSKIVHPW